MINPIVYHQQWRKIFPERIPNQFQRGIMQTPAKVLFLDIETAPNLSYLWGRFQQNAIDVKSDWHMLTYAYKWAHEDKINVVGLDDASTYKPGDEDDSWLVRQLWKLLDEADIVIAHNGRSFDIPKINSRFLIAGLKPTSPYKIVDTKVVAAKQFGFDSNALNELARQLGFGKKIKTDFELWKGVMAGDKESWRLMKTYNIHDIELLEKLYYKIRAWDQKPPQVNKGETVIEACPRCASHDIHKRGFSYTAKGRKQRYQCQNCTGWYEDSAKVIKNA